MFFILQKQNDEQSLSVDYAILKDLLEYSHFEYVEMKLSDFYNGKELRSAEDFEIKMQNGIPLGTINFVTAFLNVFKGIEKMNPIEVPKCLQTEEFLKREYKIAYGKDVVLSGFRFIKNVSTLKTFTYTGRLDAICNEADFLSKKKPVEDDDLYQISEVLNIQSEYRIYFIGGKVYAVAYYDGDATIFPDMKLIQKANLIYSMQEDYPKSYTMDVAVTNKGTAILECHPLFSCGIYQTVLGTDFLYGYRDSMDYLIKHNTKISVN